jgi:hypothetical protein
MLRIVAVSKAAKEKPCMIALAATLRHLTLERSAAKEKPCMIAV